MMILRRSIITAIQRTVLRGALLNLLSGWAAAIGMVKLVGMKLKHINKQVPIHAGNQGIQSIAVDSAQVQSQSQ